MGTALALASLEATSIHPISTRWIDTSLRLRKTSIRNEVTRRRSRQRSTGEQVSTVCAARVGLPNKPMPWRKSRDMPTSAR